MTIYEPAITGGMSFGAVAQREPLYLFAAIAIAGLIPVTLAMSLLDPRAIDGVGVWTKPLKFEVSLCLYLASLALFASWLPESFTGTRTHQVFRITVVACIAGELIWLIAAAGMGERSHFNTTSPIFAPLYGVMGLLAIILTSPTLVYGIKFLQEPNTSLGNAFNLSVALGLILTFVLTVLVAGYLAQNMSHAAVGSQPDPGTNRLAVLGWLREGGDLRVAHFFATHAMHIVPIAGAVIGLLAPQRLGVIAVYACAACYAGLVVATFVQAIRGQPFI